MMRPVPENLNINCMQPGVLADTLIYIHVLLLYFRDEIIDLQQQVGREQSLRDTLKEEHNVILNHVKQEHVCVNEIIIVCLCSI